MVEAAVTADNTCDTKPLRVGLDIGSTTVKAVVLDQTDSLDAVLFSDYRRHHANVRATVAGLLGHSQPSTTLDIYTHAFDKNKKAASRVLQEGLEI